jgi:hypothetical protein
MNTRHGNQGKYLTALFVISLLLTACKPATPAPVATQASEPSATAPATTKPTEPTAQPSPTSTATATLIPTQTFTPSPTTSPTIPPAPTPQPVLLTEWKMTNFVVIPSGCKFPDLTCWQTVTVREKTKFKENGVSSNLGPPAQNSQSTLSSKTSLLIDPSWNNPRLVYWYDNQMNGDIYVTVKVDKGLQISIWENLTNYSFKGQSMASAHWQTDALDLSKYKGQKIFIRFEANIIRYHNT